MGSKQVQNATLTVEEAVAQVLEMEEIKRKYGGLSKIAARAGITPSHLRYYVTKALDERELELRLKAQLEEETA